MSLKKQYTRLPSQSGFTLLEVMIVVAIIAILSTVAVASLNTLIPRNQVNSVVNKLRSDMYKARMAAVKNNRESLVDFTNTSGSSTFMACFDENGDGNCVAADDTIIAQLDFDNHPHALLSSINIGTGASSFRFNARGMVTLNGNVGITCKSEPSYSRSVVFFRTGRILIN